MSNSEGRSAGSSWIEQRTSQYDIREGVDITEENCREHINYWVRLISESRFEKGACNNGRQIHIPRDPSGDTIRPLCNSRDDGGNWERKELPVFPPGWETDKLCQKCIAILRGEDYGKRDS